MKSLIIVEAPTKAHKIQDFLGDNYTVLASKGHICDLSTSKGIGVDINNDFKPHYILSKDKISILDNIINAAQKADNILLCSDADREGEAIAYHLRRYLSSCNTPIFRIETREITKQALLDAIAKPRQIDENLFHAQEARRILDRIVGFLVSPFLIQFFGSNLSAGRVQSVAVKMIAEREKEIEVFKPEEYWNVVSGFKNQDGKEFNAKLEKKIKNKDDAEKIVNLIKAADDFYVEKIDTKQKKEKPPAPFITSKMQQYMATKYKFSAERTMTAAQALYENGICTYIRTDAPAISAVALASVREWISKNNLDLPETVNSYNSKKNAQNAHECIRPTNVNNLYTKIPGSPDMKLLYKAIWQHFVASQLNPAVYDTVSIEIRSRSNNKLVFKTSGKCLSYKGYLEVFDDVNTNDKINIPHMQEGEILDLVVEKLKQDQKFTQPPPRYNDATLIKDLESYGIGRPATFAEIIKKINQRAYVEKQNNSYHATELGKKITNILNKYFSFMEYEFTALVEKQLDCISEGKLSHTKMLQDFYNSFKENLVHAYKDNGGIICKCGAPMVARVSSRGEFYGCIMFPSCRETLTIEKSA